MSLRIGHKLPKKTDPKIFEQMVKDCANKKYNKEFNLYGRTGQNQHGIDIYSINDFAEVIQCKNYTTNDKKALKIKINEDFQSAYKYFCEEKKWNFTSFIVATSADKDTCVDDVIIEHNLNNDIKIEIWFWEDIEEIILENHDLLLKYYKPFVIDIRELRIVHTDNEAYAKSFSETLFLHKEQPDSKVNLCNLFVMPKYDNFKTDLEKKLSAFVKSDKRFLFIEGDAGCGKSTLVSWMNYHLQNNDNTAKNIFGDRPVITIRLRELTEEIEKEKSLSNAILKYMGFDNEEDLNNRFPKAVMILDGFDELCMIEGISDYNSLLYKLHQKGKADKYIITSRPKYIDSNIHISRERITLQHFDKEKRQEWIEYYTSPNYCNQTLEQDVKKYIENISEKNDSAIFDTPMTLYMLAAKNEDIDIDKNSWELYHQIFYHELGETKYNVMFGGSGHSISKCSDIIYNISEEIAFRMYQTNNNQLFVVYRELKDIVDTLTGTEGQSDYDDNTRKWVKQCYALCNYWKETGIEGAVEFYHNNIRDFFLCEKIYRELNAIYADYQLSPNDKIGKLIEFFKQFTKAPLQDMVCKFILLRAEKDVNDKNSFVYKEKNQRLLPYLFEKMLTEHKHYKSLDEEKHIEAIVNILSCTAQVYRHIYEHILEEKEYMKWWNSVDNINEKSDIITYCFRYIFEHRLMSEYVSISNRIDIHSLNLFKKDLRNMDFQGANLSGADLSGADLRDADLIGANLRGADLIGANLSGANLSGAYLSGADLRNADLRDANLRKADLSDAYLIGADLRGADLRDADLIGANLSGAYLNRAYLSRADLGGADLSRADLSGADLRDAYLRGATLPDGFEGDSQEEQVQHLKEMDIEGLKI